MKKFKIDDFAGIEKHLRSMLPKKLNKHLQFIITHKPSNSDMLRVIDVRYRFNKDTKVSSANPLYKFVYHKDEDTVKIKGLTVRHVKEVINLDIKYNTVWFFNSSVS